MRFYTKELAADNASETLDSLKEHGGLIVENVDEATHLLADTLTKEVQDLNSDLSRRTTHWVKECCKFRTTVWSTKALEWKGWQFQPVPGPNAGIPCGNEKPAVITLTGYTGYQRESLKTLINMTGAECTPALTKSNTHLLCKEPSSKKAVAAAQWGVKVVNHLWIMDSVLTWKWQPADPYKSPGEKILEDGEWTCLSQVARDSASMKHPRDLVEKTWPLAEEDEIAATPESGEAAANAHDSNAPIDETQSSQGSKAGQAGGSKHSASAPSAAAPVVDEQPSAKSSKRKIVSSPTSNDSVGPIPQQASTAQASAPKQKGGTSPVPRTSVSFAAGQPRLKEEAPVPQHSKANDDEEEEDEEGLFTYLSSKNCDATASQVGASVLMGMSGSAYAGADAEEDEDEAGEGEQEKTIKQIGDTSTRRTALSPSLSDTQHSAAGSPVFGDSRASSRRDSKGSTFSSNAKGVRNLTSEFQYDLGDATQASGVDNDECADDTKGLTRAESVTPGAAPRSSPQTGGMAGETNSRRKGGLNSAKSAPSSAIKRVAATAGKTSVAASPVVAAVATEQASRTLGRGRGKQQKVDMLQNVLDDNYESMAFGQDGGGGESLAFDGNFDNDVCVLSVRVCVCVSKRDRT